MTGIDWSVALAGLATGVAVVTFIRVQELPTVECIVTRDESEEARYAVSVSNPSRRLIILDKVEVLGLNGRRKPNVHFRLYWSKGLWWATEGSSRVKLC